MQINDNFYMKLAIDEAWKYQLLTYPNPAVGCVVVKNGELLSIEAHKNFGSSHAELEALKVAFLKKNPNSLLKVLSNPFEISSFLEQNHNNFFNDCEIFVTLEPCNHIGKTPSCAKLLSILKPRRVIVSNKDINKIASGGIDTLKSSNIEITTNCMQKEGAELLLPFLKWSSGTFIFFKMAQTLNGCIDGQISSNIGKIYVHTLRDKADVMLIGGNTVRVDAPILDARYVLGKAPDVFIYSRKSINSFDNNIPLFKVPNRKVIVSNDLFQLLDYKFVMVEGTYNLLNILKEKIDYFILLISPKIRNGSNALSNLDIDFEIVHENFIGSEKIVFLRKKLVC